MPSALLFELLATRAGPRSGPGFLAGTVDVNDAPARRRVAILTRADRLVVADVFSAPDGTWVVHGLNPDIEFDIIGRDYTRTWQDVIVGAVKPKPYE